MPVHHRLTVGLPVYNGASLIEESLDALLGQSFTDFELVISDNASTDGTEDICRAYAKADDRVRYVRLPRNIGACPNHNILVELARGELFKWASSDDLYGRDLLARCVAVLDERPEIALVHSHQGIIDGAGGLRQVVEYPLDTASPHAAERFRSVLFAVGGDDFYGVVRTPVLRDTRLNGSYHHSDRVLVAELALRTAFHQVPEVLFFRRDHEGRAERARPTVRARCTNMDPRRASRWRHPVARLYGEYIWAFADAIRRAPLTAGERWECARHLRDWLFSRAIPHERERIEDREVEAVPDLDLSAIVAGRSRQGAP
jgi:glycosyltransferase involved in cell wall biosynthesis